MNQEKTQSRVYCLFDSGSPKSFISEELIPNITCNPHFSGFRGLANQSITSLGHAEGRVTFRNTSVYHSFIILPKSQTAWSMIAGRDLLKKMNIHLHYVSYRYSREYMLSLCTKHKYTLATHVKERLDSLGILENSSKEEADIYKQSISKSTEEKHSRSEYIPNHGSCSNPVDILMTFAELYAIDLSTEANTVFNHS